MTKTKLIESIYKRQSRLSEKEIGDIVNTLLSEMISSLENSERIEIRGFGSFKLNFWGPRHARNPESGETWRTAPVHAVHFKPGNALRDAVNDGFLKQKAIIDHADESVASEQTAETNTLETA